MSVTYKLKNSITAITGREVYVIESVKIEADKLLMNAKLPCVLMYVENQRQVLAVGSQYVEQITATLLFVEQTKYKASDDNNKIIQDSERHTALSFFAELRNRHTYESVELLQGREVYDGFRRIATGYALQVKVCELYGVCADGGGEYSRELSITANGTYDVVDYDKLNVNIKPFNLWLWLINNSSGDYADSIKPEWLQPLDLSLLAPGTQNNMYFNGIKSDIEVIFPNGEWNGILRAYCFSGVGSDITITVTNLKEIYTNFFRQCTAKEIRLPDWTGFANSGMNYLFSGCANLEVIRTGTLSMLIPYNTFWGSLKLHTIEVGPGSDVRWTNSTLTLSSWVPTYWTATEEGRILLNENLRKYFIPNIIDVHDEEGSKILRFGWYPSMDEENRTLLTNKGYTITA